MQSYMLDTNIFNRLLDEQIPANFFADKYCLVTHVQKDELEQTPDSDRKELLLKQFEGVSGKSVATASAVYGISRYGQARYSSKNGCFKEMLARLQELDKAKKKRKDPANQIKDILIAETALKQGAILISTDGNLRQVMTEFDGQVIDPNL